MRFFWLSILFLCFSVALNAQGQLENADIVFGPLFSVEERAVPKHFVGSDQSGFYLQYALGLEGDGDSYLHKFGFDLNPIISKPLNVEVEGEKAYTERVFMLKNRLYQVTRTRSKSDMKVFLHEINRNTLELESVTKLSCLIGTEKSAKQSSLSVSFSNDSSKVIVIYSIPSKGNNSESFRAHVFSDEFDELWSQTFELPYENRLLDVQDYAINNDGKLFVTAKRYFNNRRESVDGKANYEYLLYSLQESGNVDSLRIHANDKFLKDMRIEVTADGNVVSAGIYSDHNETAMGGAFFLKMDGKTGKEITSSFKEFDMDFFTQNMSKKNAKRVLKRREKGKDIDLANYYIDHLVPKSDGGVYMIGEKRMAITSYVNGGIVASPTTDYFYDDIVVVDIDPQGQIITAERIGKLQGTSNDDAVYSSYTWLKREDELVLLFNDHFQNLEYKGEGKIKSMSKNAKTVVMTARVGADGSVSRSGLFRSGEAEITIRPALSQRLNENELLLFGHKSLRNQRFVIVKFK